MSQAHHGTNCVRCGGSEGQRWRAAQGCEEKGSGCSASEQGQEFIQLVVPCGPGRSSRTRAVPLKALTHGQPDSEPG
eukprot:851165-Rhodomonas_salina.2